LKGIRLGCRGVRIIMFQKLVEEHARNKQKVGDLGNLIIELQI
jgi:hypothetical protein